MSFPKTFEELGLSADTLAALQQKGFTEPSPIQAQTIPLLLAGDTDVVGQAQTGTGKTAAFGLPLIERITTIADTPQAIILAPTRELAIQVAEEINTFQTKRKLRITAIYGGQSIVEQIRQLRRGIDIVVGTPGRILDHLERKTINLSNVKFVVLDEADEMLNMGFVEDIETILEHVPDERRMLLFSATMPDRILQLARNYMGTYKLVSVKSKQLTTELTRQVYYEIKPNDKLTALCRVIDFDVEFYGIVFCNTKANVDEVTEQLASRGYAAEALHGDISQNQRERILQKFKAKQVNIVVATDVAARGIDVNNLTHVINYSLPHDPEVYVHRIGRTGRAGREGTAISFVSRADRRKLDFIEKVAKAKIQRAQLPSVKELIGTKKPRIIDEVLNEVKNGVHFTYSNIAEELLAESDPVSLVASILKLSYQNELDPNNYIEVEPDLVSSKDDRKKTKKKVKLNIELGRKDDFTFKKLIHLIENGLRIKGLPSRDVQVFDRSSFVICFEDEANRIAEYMERQYGKVTRQRKQLVYISAVK